MTAIVGVLNKHAIAIAADSAETIGTGVKIYNKANKVFTLSKHHPIGIAIYSSAAFSSLIPWEIIIKMYRKHLGTASFDSVKEYATNFIEYLETYRKSYLKSEDYNNILCEELLRLYYAEFVSQLPRSDAETGIIHPDDLEQLKIILNSIKAEAIKTKKFPLLSSLSLEEFISITSDLFILIKEQIETAKGNYSDYESLIQETFFEIYTRMFLTGRSFTGIAFYGYGEAEIYPSLHKIEVYNCVNDKLIWHEVKTYEINNLNSSIICPMAQTDVMDTYMTGISPAIEQAFVQLTAKTVKKVLNTIKDIVKPIDTNIANAIGTVNLSPFMKQYQSDITQFKIANSIQPLMDTVATMEKEDLAELAENLIYLTSLKRRITPNLESVGGPVDVAIISKGDGFIWIKRKHYFDASLNRCYFETYFEHDNK